MFDGGLVKIFAQFLIIYEDFDDYVRSYREFINYEHSKGIPLDRGSIPRDTSSKSPSVDHPSPDTMIRGGSIPTEAGGGFQEKERATIGLIEQPVNRESESEHKSPITPVTPTGSQNL